MTMTALLPKCRISIVCSSLRLSVGDGIFRYVQRFSDPSEARMAGECSAILAVYKVGVHRDLGGAQIERKDLVRKTDDDKRDLLWQNKGEATGGVFMANVPTIVGTFLCACALRAAVPCAYFAGAAPSISSVTI